MQVLIRALTRTLGSAGLPHLSDRTCGSPSHGDIRVTTGEGIAQVDLKARRAAKAGQVNFCIVAWSRCMVKGTLVHSDHEMNRGSHTASIAVLKISD